MKNAESILRSRTNIWIPKTWEWDNQISFPWSYNGAILQANASSRTTCQHNHCSGVILGIASLYLLHSWIKRSRLPCTSADFFPSSNAGPSGQFEANLQSDFIPSLHPETSIFKHVMWWIIKLIYLWKKYIYEEKASLKVDNCLEKLFQM